MPFPEHERPVPDYRAFLDAYERAWRQYQEAPSPRNRARLAVGEQTLYRELMKPGKVELGQLVATPGSLHVLESAGHIPPEFLLRHKHGDWGELEEEDRQANEAALSQGSRLLSAYQTRREEKLWVITEWDRSVTTLLLPAEY